MQTSRATKKGGGFPDLDLSAPICPYLSFCVLLCPLWGVSDLFGISWFAMGFSQTVLFPFFGQLSEPRMCHKEQFEDEKSTGLLG